MAKPFFLADLCRFTIRAGNLQLPTLDNQNSEEEVKLHRQASDLFVHENYDKRTLQNDIALIKLKRPYELKPSIRTICLPDETKALDRPGDKGIVAGWGSTKPRKPGAHDPLEISQDLLESEFEIQPNQTCKNSTSDKHKNDIDPRVTFCAGDGLGGKDVCQGDSGGSFMREVERNGRFKWVSIGLVSWGEGCGMKNKHGFYTRIGPFVDWIEKTIRDNS